MNICSTVGETAQKSSSEAEISAKFVARGGTIRSHTCGGQRMGGADSSLYKYAFICCFAFNRKSHCDLLLQPRSLCLLLTPSSSLQTLIEWRRRRPWQPRRFCSSGDGRILTSSPSDVIISGSERANLCYRPLARGAAALVNYADG